METVPMLDPSHSSGRGDACARWMTVLRPDLRRYLRRYHSYINVANQEDVLQDAFLVFMGNPQVPGTGYRGDLTSRTGVLSYLRQVLNFKAREHLQRETGTKDPSQVVQVLSLDSPEVINELENKGIDPETEESLEAARIYAYLIEPLPETLRILVDRYYIKGESIDELMADFKYPNRMTLFRRLMKARELIKPRLLTVKKMRKEGQL